MSLQALKPAARALFERPQQPTLFRELPNEPERFETIEELAARIHELRGRGGLQLTACHAVYPGFATFPGISVYLTPKGGDPDWIGMVAIQQQTVQHLQDALQTTRQRKAA